MATINRKTVTIDATDKVLGRLASQIAFTLIGKDDPIYQAHIDAGSIVIVENCDKIKVTGKKFTDKLYHHHSNHPGGLHTQTMREMWQQKSPAEVLRKAVSRMLPKNRHRTNRMLRLKIS